MKNQQIIVLLLLSIFFHCSYAICKESENQVMVEQYNIAVEPDAYLGSLKQIIEFSNGDRIVLGDASRNYVVKFDSAGTKLYNYNYDNLSMIQPNSYLSKDESKLYLLTKYSGSDIQIAVIDTSNGDMIDQMNSTSFMVQNRMNEGNTLDVDEEEEYGYFNAYGTSNTDSFVCRFNMSNVSDLDCQQASLSTGNLLVSSVINIGGEDLAVRAIYEDTDASEYGQMISKFAFGSETFDWSKKIVATKLSSVTDDVLGQLLPLEENAKFFTHILLERGFIFVTLDASDGSVSSQYHTQIQPTDDTTMSVLSMGLADDTHVYISVYFSLDPIGTASMLLFDTSSDSLKYYASVGWQFLGYSITAFSDGTYGLAGTNLESDDHVYVHFSDLDYIAELPEAHFQEGPVIIFEEVTDNSYDAVDGSFTIAAASAESPSSTNTAKTEYAAEIEMYGYTINVWNTVVVHSGVIEEDLTIDDVYYTCYEQTEGEDLSLLVTEVTLLSNFEDSALDWVEFNDDTNSISISSSIPEGAYFLSLVVTNERNYEVQSVPISIQNMEVESSEDSDDSCLGAKHDGGCIGLVILIIFGCLIFVVLVLLFIWYLAKRPKRPSVRDDNEVKEIETAKALPPISAEHGEPAEEGKTQKLQVIEA